MTDPIEKSPEESPEARRAKFRAVPRIFAKLACPPSCDFCGKVLGKGADRLVSARADGTFTRPNICEGCVEICTQLVEGTY